MPIEIIILLSVLDVVFAICIFIALNDKKYGKAVWMTFIFVVLFLTTLTIVVYGDETESVMVDEYQEAIQAYQHSR
ncbi:hypothetical protein ABN224_16475 [Providencia rettgeri]|nr:hypothetical protein NFC79_20940 [Providencia stuartii]